MTDDRSGSAGATTRPGTRWTARAMLPADDRAPRSARRLTSTLLLAWGCADRIELAELIVSELVSNAVRHAAHAGDLELELSLGPDGIELSVADGSPDLPVLRPDAGEDGGLGLHLVDRIASRWGVEEHLLGKRVWVEL
jgi:anti-sigma regulatory factor (Ser/Thr protein kinase)